jgi:hypothetical protein
VVGDDFELICWDLVSDPSTPNAWIGHPDELRAYVESDGSKAGKGAVNEKIDRINQILG